VWLVGAHGVIMHATDGNFYAVASPTQKDLVAAWGSASNDVYAIGTQILHYDGTNWSVVRNNAGEQFADIWGSGPKDIWAVGTTTAGAASLVLHFDGSTWSTIDSKPGEHPISVWSASPDDVWIAGGDGHAIALLRHWDGTRFTAPLGADKLASLTKVRGSGTADVWFQGSYSLTHWDGASLTNVDGNWGPIALWVGAPNNVWLVQYQGLFISLWHWNGISWSRLESLRNDARIGAMFGPTNDIWIVGSYSGTSVYALQNTGTGWNSASVLAMGSTGANALWGSSANDIWAVNQTPSIAHFDGTAWHATLVYPMGTRLLRAIWGSGPTDVWTAGDKLGLHFDGPSWTEIPELASASIYSISGSASNDVWAVGSGVFHNDGTGFKQVAGAGTFTGRATLENGPSDVWFTGGPAGTAIHFDGLAFAPVFVPTGSGDDLKALWGTGSNNFWAVGNGTAVNWNGKRWQRFLGPGGIAVWGSAAADVWTAGSSGIYHYDGTSWGKVQTDLDAASYTSIWGSGPGDVWFATQTSLQHYRE
jgi:hypothetical protein